MHQVTQIGKARQGGFVSSRKFNARLLLLEEVSLVTFRFISTTAHDGGKKSDLWVLILKDDAM